MHKTRYFHLLIIILLLLITSRNVYAQGNGPPQDGSPPGPPPPGPPAPPVELPPRLEPSLRFSHRTVDDGLADNLVRAILQDSKGFIWFGTENGLSRFDGYQFKTYRHDPSNLNSLSANFVWDIFEDEDGILWLATEDGGVNRFDPYSETFTHFQYDPDDPNSLGGDTIFSIFKDSNRNFWFGGPPLSGLNKFNPTTGQITRFKARPEPQPSPGAYRIGAAWRIIEDASGYLWITADFALARLDPQSGYFTYYQLPLSEPRLAAIYQDQAGTIWLGGQSGLYKFNPNTEQIEHIPGSPGQIFQILSDEQGRFWIAADGLGLYLFDPKQEQIVGHYRHNPGNPDGIGPGRPLVLYQDQGGVIWIGGTNGVSFFDPQQTQFASFQHDTQNPQSLSGSSVSAISADETGRLWLVSGGQLNRLDFTRQEISHYPLPKEGGRGGSNAIYRDPSGLLWLSVGERVYKFDPVSETFTRIADLRAIRNRPGPPAIIDSIYQSDADTLWVAARRFGLYQFNTRGDLIQFINRPPALDQGEQIESPTLIPDFDVTDIEPGQDNDFWLGYARGYLSRYDLTRKTFQHYYPPQLGWVYDIYLDQGGTIWLATQEGLCRFDPQTGTVTAKYTEQHGLPSAYVVSIEEDATGNLWLGTRSGLAKFDPKSETFHSYDAADGLPGNEFTARATWQAADGRIFFGNKSGLLAFYPEQIENSRYQPPVVLTDLRLFNEPVMPGAKSLLTHPIWNTDELALSYDQQIISFEFAALSYAAPHKNQYRYRLEGFEEKWNEVDSRRRFANYTSLPAGSYTFRVQGSNEDGEWSESEVTLSVIVKPPWWATGWFRGSVLVGLVGLAYGGYRWRVSAIERRNRLLETQVADRTRDLSERTEQLAASNRELMVAKERAQEAQHAAEAANQAKSTFLANMSHELRSPLNAIIGFAQVMARSETLSADDQENVGIIRRSGEHLLMLINQVLDLSKIEAGRITLNETGFDLYRLLADLEDMFALKADDKRLQLIIDYSSDLPQYIRTDEVKLRQVLINLLTNALKFTEEGGVTLRVRLVIGGNGSIKNDMALSLITNLQFEVEDSGPGITPAELDKLFEAFAQTETGRKAQEGTGLGLSISRNFIQLMGGDIIVNSQLGQGTRFTFNIQAQALDTIDTAKSNNQSRVIGLEPGQPRYRILVVDDKWANRQLVVKLLAPLGFEIREAENGQGAIEIWREFEPQLVWMDMRMPVMDGFEATKRIKATPQGQATAVIALTASSFEEERAIILSTGCDDFVRKPFQESEIYQMMGKHIGVRYLYESPAFRKSVTNKARPDLNALKSTVDSLPDKLLRQLIEGTELGDIEMIDGAIAQIDHQDPALAETLAHFAGKFEYDKILSLIQDDK